MTATPDPYREWDAAYVLGALSPHDRRAFEQHLATCAACREAVAELAGMPGILGMLTAEHADALVDDARTDVPAEASGGAGAPSCRSPLWPRAPGAAAPDGGRSCPWRRWGSSSRARRAAWR